MKRENPPQSNIDNIAALYRSGDLNKAERECRGLLKIYPCSLPVINVLGAALQGQGKLDQAVQVFNKAITCNPEYAAAYYNLGVVLHGLGQLEKAVDSYDKAISLKPDYVDAYSNRGNALKDLGELHKAVESYSKAIQLRPDYAEAYSNRGNTQRDLGQDHEAVMSYKKAIEINPDYAEAYVNYGLVLKNLGYLEEAVDKYNTSILLNPYIAEAYNNRGIALSDLGRTADAIENYNKAIEINSDYAEAYVNHGNILTNIGRPEDALGDYDKAIQINPGLVEGYSNYGIALREVGELDQAVHMLQLAVTKDPENITSSDSLIDLLNFYIPSIEYGSSYLRAQKLLNKIDTYIVHNNQITDEAVHNLYEQYENIMADCNLKIKTNYSQLYRGSIIDLGCKRHKVVFDKFNIIPEYCFNCYKVTLYPRTVLELIKVFILFNKINLPNDNMRKCIVELRPEISGTYKCFIYCKSLGEASMVMDNVRLMVDNNLSEELPIVIKRGCSEYEASYPGYSVVDDVTSQIGYDKKWREHELYVDNLLLHKGAHNPNNFTFNHNGVTLLDGVVMCNWLAYAKSIGDLSYRKISTSNNNCFTKWMKSMFDARPSFS